MSTFAATRPGFGYEKPAEGITNDWLTPPELVKRLGEFDLDPCGCPGQPWLLAAETYFPPDEDGLIQPWYGRVFCNPPYGPHVAQWVRKLAAHGDGILLIFSRVETKAWEAVWSTADAILFPFGRVCFFRPDGTRAKSGTAPSALVAYGEHNALALLQSGIEGAYISRPQPVLGERVRVTKL